MATTNENQGNQPIGTVQVVHGTVQAQSADNSVRVLELNSPVYLNDRIITGEDGRITIVLNDAAHTQLDLGRMADVVLDDDVFQQGTPAEFSEATAEVAQIQQALATGEFDPTTDLDPTAAGPAAGGAASDGGGSSYVEFSLTGEAVTPTSGAETTGVALSFLDPQLSELEEPIVLAAAPTPAAPTPAAAPAPVAPAAIVPDPPVVPPPPPPPPPVVPEVAALTRVVEEEAFDSGNPDEEDNPEDSDFNNPYQNDVAKVTGNLNDIVDFGSDTPGTFSISMPLSSETPLPDVFSQGDPVSYNLNGTTLEAWADGRLIFTLDVQSDGSYTFELLDQLDHVAGGGENSALLTGSGSVSSLQLGSAVSATDSTGDTVDFPAGAMSFIVVDDVPILVPIGEDSQETDGPSVLASSGIASLYVQEDALGNTTSNPFNDTDTDSSTGNLYHDYQTDHDVFDLSGLVKVGADDPLTWSLVRPDGFVEDSNLTSNGNQVYYLVEGNTLTGYTGDLDDPHVVFTFTVDALTGQADFNLNDQLDHSPGLVGTDYETLQISDLGAFVNATDFDGDSVNLAGRITVSVENDVPEIEGRLLSGTVYEDGLDNLNSQGIGGGATTVSVDLSTLVEDGADESVSYRFADLTNQSSDLTSHNNAVTYSTSGNVLTASAGGIDVFTVTLATNGTATFTLLDQLDHGNAGLDGIHGTEDDTGAGDAGFLSITDLGKYIEAVDTDGDVVDFTDKFTINVENDVPEIVGGPLSGKVYEDGLNNANSHGIGGGAITVDINLGSLVEDGADEHVSYQFTELTNQSTDLTSHNNAVTYSTSGNVLTASAGGIDVFTVTLANGTATFTLLDQLDHGNAGLDGIHGTEDDTGAGDAGFLSITDLGKYIEAIDADGDVVDFTDKFTINVENDVPEIVGGPLSGTVYEDGLNNANSHGIGGGATTVDVNLSSLVNNGADENVNYQFTELTNQSTDLTSHNNAVTYSTSGNVLTASAGGIDVFTVTLANGTATFTLLDQLDHGNAGLDGIHGTEDDTEAGDGGFLSITDLGKYIEAIDADGDVVDFTDKFIINVENDVPEIVGGPLSGKVYEDGLNNANSHGIGGGATAVDINLGTLVEDGADEHVSNYQFTNLTNQSTNLTSHNNAVTYSTTGNLLTASAGGIAVFTVLLATDGKATFTLLDQLDHGEAGPDDIHGTEDDTGAGETGLLSINDLGQYIQAFDADGDVINFANKFTINVENDVPEITGRPLSGTVYEDGLDNANSQGIGGGTTSVDVNLGSLIEDGADEHVSYRFADLNNQTSLLTSHNNAVTYSTSGNVLTASAGGIAVFTVSLATNGTATFTLLDQLDHGNAGQDGIHGTEDDTGAGDAGFLSIDDLGQYIEAIDADGDVVDFTGKFTINVENDVPQIGNPQDSILAVQEGNHLTASLDIIGSGADEPASLEITLLEGAAVMTTALSGGKQMTNNGHPLFWHENPDGSWSAVTESSPGVLDFNAKSFTVSVDSSTGTYTVTQVDGLDGGATTVHIGFAQSLNGGNETEAVFGNGGVFLLAKGSTDQNAFDFHDGTAKVNYSSQGIGVDVPGGDQGAFVEGIGVDDGATRSSEILSFKFYSTIVYDNPNNPGTVNEGASTALDVSSVSVLIDHFGSKESAYYTLWNDGVQVSAQQVATYPGAQTAGGTSSDDFTIHIDSSQLNSGTVFDEIRFEAGGISNAKGETAGDYRVVSVDLDVYQEGFDQTIVIPFEVTDADGDTAASDFSITFDGNSIINAAAADALDGDTSTNGMVIAGSDRAEDITGTDYNDTIDGGGGDDNIDGGGGDDFLVGNIGDDVIYGGDGDDTLDGGEGDDQLIGGDGVDTLDGGEGNDVLVGDDVDFGTPGNSNIVEDGVTDTIIGGSGTDTAGDAGSNDITDESVEFHETDIDTLIPPPEDV